MYTYAKTFISGISLFLSCFLRYSCKNFLSWCICDYIFVQLQLLENCIKKLQPNDSSRKKIVKSCVEILFVDILSRYSVVVVILLTKSTRFRYLIIYNHIVSRSLVILVTYLLSYYQICLLSIFTYYVYFCKILFPLQQHVLNLHLTYDHLVQSFSVY